MKLRIERAFARGNSALDFTNWLFALIMEVAFPTGAGLTQLFAGFVPCKRSVGL